MGEAMRSVEHITAIAGKGLEGDRYAEGKGAFSRGKVPKIRHVSFIGLGAFRPPMSVLELTFAGNSPQYCC